MHALRTARAVFIAMTALLAATPSIGAGAPPPDKPVPISSLSDDERVMIMIRLARSGRHAQAARLLKAFPPQGPHGRNRTLFIEGLILRGYGDNAGAVGKFRSALAADPDLSMVRAELATTLAAMGEGDSAKHHLEQLMTEAPDEKAALEIKSFIDSIDADRPYRLSTYISLAPSTNVNNGTHHDTIYTQFGAFTPGNRKTSGIGIAGGLNGGYTHSLTEDWSVVAGAGLNGSLYEDHDYNTLTASETLEFRHRFRGGQIGIGPVASQTLSNVAPDMSETPELASWTVGLRLNLLYQLSPQTGLQWTTLADTRVYENAPHYDADAISQQLILSHGFAQGFSGHLLAGFEYVDTETRLYDNVSVMAGAGLYRELPMGLTLSGDARLRFTQYQDDWALIGDMREDLRFDGRVAVSKRDWDIFGYAPEIAYSYSVNDSNVAVYDFDSHTVDFRLTKDF